MILYKRDRGNPVALAGLSLSGCLKRDALDHQHVVTHGAGDGPREPTFLPTCIEQSVGFAEFWGGTS